MKFLTAYVQNTWAPFANTVEFMAEKPLYKVLSSLEKIFILHLQIVTVK